jgi:hypothetical protein
MKISNFYVFLFVLVALVAVSGTSADLAPDIFFEQEFEFSTIDLASEPVVIYSIDHSLKNQRILFLFTDGNKIISSDIFKTEFEKCVIRYLEINGHWKDADSITITGYTAIESVCWSGDWTVSGGYTYRSGKLVCW